MKFSEFFQNLFQRAQHGVQNLGNHSPKGTENRGGEGAGGGAPEPEACQGGQEKTNSDIPTTNAKGKIYPAGCQCCPHNKLGQNRKAPPRHLEKIRRGSQYRPDQQTPNRPEPDKLRRHHRNSPFPRRGSS